MALTGRNSPTHTMSVASAPRRDGFELGLGDAVAHDAHHRRGPADHGAITARRYSCFRKETRSVRGFSSRSSEPIETAAQACRDNKPASRRAAYRRGSRPARSASSRAKAAPLAPWPCSTSGASALTRREMRHSAWMSRQAHFAGNRNALDAEREPRRKFGENSVGARAAGRAVDDQADAMAALDLALRDIHHVPEQSAERRAQNMQNLEAGRSKRGLRPARPRARASPRRPARRRRPNVSPAECRNR